MSRNSLLEAGAKSEGEVTTTGLEPRTTYFLNEHSTIWPNWPPVTCNSSILLERFKDFKASTCLFGFQKIFLN